MHMTQVYGEEENAGLLLIYFHFVRFLDYLHSLWMAYDVMMKT